MLKTPVHALLLLMIAMLCVQGSGSLAKILFQSFPVLTVSAMRLCFGAIILAIIFKIWTINFKAVRWKAILSYGTLEMIALRSLTPLSFGTLMSLEPAVAALSGFIFLGETLLWNQWLALGTIIIASIGCTFTTQHARQQKVNK